MTKELEDYNHPFGHPEGISTPMMRLHLARMGWPKTEIEIMDFSDELLCTTISRLNGKRVSAKVNWKGKTGKEVVLEIIRQFENCG